MDKLIKVVLIALCLVYLLSFIIKFRLDDKSIEKRLDEYDYQNQTSIKSTVINDIFIFIDKKLDEIYNKFK